MATTTKTAQDFLSVVESRRSVRAYENVEISQEELTSILETAILAPSSSNLQPWRFLVAHDADSKSKLIDALMDFNKDRVAEASAGIVILGDLLAYTKAEQIYSQNVEKGIMTEEIKNQFVQNTINGYSAMPDEKRKDIALIDGGLVSMQLMLAARAQGYDTLPMGGFNAAKLKELFQIPDQYVPVMVIALGKKAQEGRPSTRLPLQDVTFWNEIN